MRLFSFPVVGILALSSFAQAALTVVERPAPQGNFDYFGNTVVVVADQNSDGIRDIVASSTPAALTTGTLIEPGRANVLSAVDGSLISTITAPTPSDCGNFGNVYPLSDLTGDGFPEFAATELNFCLFTFPQPTSSLISRVHIYNGSTLALLSTIENPSAQQNSGFANHIVSVPDVNNDGVADIAIGAGKDPISGQTYKGKVYIYSGANRALLNTFQAASAEQNEFGWSVAGISDVTGDSRGDLVVMAGFANGTGPTAALVYPRTYVINGNTGAVVRELANPSPTVGQLVGGVGIGPDQSGDGKPEVFVRLPEASVAGTSRVGIVQLVNPVNGNVLYSYTANSTDPLSKVGFGSGTLHDVNLDGTNDYYLTHADWNGRIFSGYVQFRSGVDNSLLFNYSSPRYQDYGLFGYTVSHPDFSGDGQPDLIITAGGEETLTIQGFNQFQGKIYLISGASASLSGSTTFSKFHTLASTSRTFVLQNTGVSPLTINSVQLTNNAANAFVFNNTPDVTPLAPGASRNIVVNFVPVPGGTYTANLVIDTSADDFNTALTGYNYEPEIYNNRPIYFSADDKVILIQTEDTTPQVVTDNTHTGSPLNYIFAMGYESPTTLLLQNYIGLVGGFDSYEIQRVNLLSGDRETISTDTNSGQGQRMGYIRDMVVDEPRNRILGSTQFSGLIAIDLTTGNRTFLPNNLGGSGFNSITKSPTGEFFALRSGGVFLDSFNPATNQFTFTGIGSNTSGDASGLSSAFLFAKSATQLVAHGFYNPISVDLQNLTVTMPLRFTNPLNSSAGGPSIVDQSPFDASGYDTLAGYFLRRTHTGIVLFEESTLFRRTLINNADVTGTYRMQFVTVPYETHNETTVPSITLGNVTYELPGEAEITFTNNQTLNVLQTNFFPGTAQTFVPNPYPGIWYFRGLPGGTFSCFLRFRYNGQTVLDAGLGEGTATIYRSTDNGATWNPVPTTVNPATDTVETTNPVTEFSLWTIGFSSPSSLDNWSAHE